MSDEIFRSMAASSFVPADIILLNCKNGQEISAVSGMSCFDDFMQSEFWPKKSYDVKIKQIIINDPQGAFKASRRIALCSSGDLCPNRAQLQSDHFKICHIPGNTTGHVAQIFEPRKMLVCSVCHASHYCDKKCQRLHYPQHKGACKWLASKIKTSESENGDSPSLQLRQDFQFRATSLVSTAAVCLSQLSNCWALHRNKQLQSQPAPVLLVEIGDEALDTSFQPPFRWCVSSWQPLWEDLGPETPVENIKGSSVKDIKGRGRAVHDRLHQLNVHELYIHMLTDGFGAPTPLGEGLRNGDWIAVVVTVPRLPSLTKMMLMHGGKLGMRAAVAAAAATKGRMATTLQSLSECFCLTVNRCTGTLAPTVRFPDLFGADPSAMPAFIADGGAPRMVSWPLLLLPHNTATNHSAATSRTKKAGTRTRDEEVVGGQSLISTDASLCEVGGIATAGGGGSDVVVNLSVGARVMAVGLKSAQYNGLQGTVRAGIDSTGRVTVELEVDCTASCTVRLRPENIACATL
jgi:hypothetical protein